VRSLPVTFWGSRKSPAEGGRVVASVIAFLALTVASGAMASFPIPELGPRYAFDANKTSRAHVDNSRVDVETWNADKKAWSRVWSVRLRVGGGDTPGVPRSVADLVVEKGGRAVVVCGPTAVPQVNSKRIVLSVHERRKTYEWRLAELVRSDMLSETADGFRWGVCLGPGSGKNTYVVETAACERITLDTRDGKILSREPVPSEGPRASGCRSAK
jgi:hypothetical protein